MVRPWHRPRRPPPQRRGARPHRRQAEPWPFPRPPNRRRSAPRQVLPKLWLRRRPAPRSCPGYRGRPWPTRRRGRRRRGPRPSPRRRAAARGGVAGALAPDRRHRRRQGHRCFAPPAIARSVSAGRSRAAPGHRPCALPSASRRAIRGPRRARRRRTRRAPPGAARWPRGFAAKVGSQPPRPPLGSGRTR